MKTILLVATVFIFSGCSMTYANFKDGYKQAKIMYQDAKYVIYEVIEEKKQVEKEFTAQQ